VVPALPGRIVQGLRGPWQSHSPKWIKERYRLVRVDMGKLTDGGEGTEPSPFLWVVWQEIFLLDGGIILVPPGQVYLAEEEAFWL
jgi:hypothetical protein